MQQRATRMLSVAGKMDGSGAALITVGLLVVIVEVFREVLASKLLKCFVGEVPKFSASPDWELKCVNKQALYAPPRHTDSIRIQ